MSAAELYDLRQRIGSVAAWVFELEIECSKGGELCRTASDHLEAIADELLEKYLNALSAECRQEAS